MFKGLITLGVGQNRASVTLWVGLLVSCRWQREGVPALYTLGPPLRPSSWGPEMPSHTLLVLYGLLTFPQRFLWWRNGVLRHITSCVIGAHWVYGKSVPSTLLPSIENVLGLSDFWSGLQGTSARPQQGFIVGTSFRISLQLVCDLEIRGSGYSCHMPHMELQLKARRMQVRQNSSLPGGPGFQSWLKADPAFKTQVTSSYLFTKHREGPVVFLWFVLSVSIHKPGLCPPLMLRSFMGHSAFAL